MITILEHGKMKKARTAACDRCGCKFSFTREDCYWDRICWDYVVDCPECENEIHLGDIYHN